MSISLHNLKKSDAPRSADPILVESGGFNSKFEAHRISVLGRCRWSWPHQLMETKEMQDAEWFDVLCGMSIYSVARVSREFRIPSGKRG